MVKKKKRKNLIIFLKDFFKDVKLEGKKVVWTSKKSLIKFSVATLVFMLFICLFFVTTDLIIVGITKLKELII